MKEVQPLDVLRAWVARYPTQRDAAKALGVSAPMLTDLLYGRRSLSVRVLARLGLRRAVVKAA